MYPTLVSPEWLYAHFNSTDIRIFDATFHEHETLKRARHIFQKSHISNSFYLLLRDELTKFNYLPSPSIFTKLLTAQGLTRGVHAILYDDDGVSALRAWWLLQYFSHYRVSVLVGGLSAWRARGYPLDVKKVVKIDAAPETAFHAAPRPELLRSSAQVREFQCSSSAVSAGAPVYSEQIDAIEQYSLAVDQKSIIAKLDVGFLEERRTNIVQLVDSEAIWNKFLDEQGLFYTDLLAVKRVFRENGVNLERPVTVSGTDFQHLLHVVLAAFLCQGKGIDDVSCCIEHCVLAEQTREDGVSAVAASAAEQFVDSAGPQ